MHVPPPTAKPVLMAPFVTFPGARGDAIRRDA